MTLQRTEPETAEETQHLPALTITPQAIQAIKQEIAMLQSMVRSSLQRGIDYGRVPGTPADSLWEPGAAMIIAAFNCYIGERRILNMRDDSERISVCVEVPIVSRASQQVMATGIGAASTLETKHKYRWLNALEIKHLGFDDETLTTFKTKMRDGQTEYRVPNPEHGELLNTIIKMASKRAEVDGAEALPGVSSALRQMFSQAIPQRQSNGGKAHKEGNDEWTMFWGKVRQLGFTQDEAYETLGIASMKDDWVGAGKTLDEALEKLQGIKDVESGKQHQLV